MMNHGRCISCSWPLLGGRKFRRAVCQEERDGLASEWGRSVVAGKAASVCSLTASHVPTVSVDDGAIMYGVKTTTRKFRTAKRAVRLAAGDPAEAEALIRTGRIQGEPK